MNGRPGRGVASDTEETWRLRGACSEEHPDLFFPAGSGAASQAQARQAKQVCARCPVIDQCFAWALSTAQPHGVWGGCSEEERRLFVLRKRHASTPVIHSRVRAPHRPRGETA